MRFLSVFFIAAAVFAAMLMQVTEARSPVPPPGWKPGHYGKILTIEKINIDY